MPRRAVRDVPAPSLRTPAVAVTHEAQLTALLGKLARRAGSWGWLETYERARRGEPVPRWHVNMMELTAAKRGGELRRPEGVDDVEE